MSNSSAFKERRYQRGKLRGQNVLWNRGAGCAFICGRSGEQALRVPSARWLLAMTYEYGIVSMTLSSSRRETNVRRNRTAIDDAFDFTRSRKLRALILGV